MELLEEPEIKTAYEKCKYIVKLWEHQFQKTNNRLPSKLDIREADKNVRNAYRKYFQLKTQALERSFLDVEGFNSGDEDDENTPKAAGTETDITPEVEAPPQPEIPEEIWGKHLDNIPEDKVEKKQEVSTVNTAITEKLFCGSKFSKRNPRKSRSFTIKKSSETFDSGFLSQPLASNEETTEIQSEIPFTISNVKILRPEMRSSSQSLDIGTLGKNHALPLQNIDMGWLERVEFRSGLSTAEEFSKNFDSDSDVIEQSDEEENVAKRPRMEEIKSHKFVSGGNRDVIRKTGDHPELEGSGSYPENQVPERIQSQEKTPAGQGHGTNLGIQGHEANPENQGRGTNPKIQNHGTLKNRISGKVPKEIQKTLNEIQPENSKIKRSSSRTPKKRFELCSEEEDEDPFNTDGDSDYNPSAKETNKFVDSIPDFWEEKPTKKKTEDENDDGEKQRNPIKKKRKKKTTKDENDEDSDTAEEKQEKSVKKKRKKKQPIKNEENEETYELEYSIKPRRSAPRFKNIKKLIKTQTKTDTPKKPANKLEKKIEAGTLNENFVRIDLRKKVYSRGKKQWNFSKYKKQQWKNKKKSLTGPEMDMGGCDGGMLTCFNCGNIGHFARHCLKAKGDSLLPLDADKEEIELPTLEEAAKIAKESVLAVRRSNLPEERKSNCPEENPNSNSGSDDDDNIFNDSDDEKLLAETLRLEEHVTKLDLGKYVDKSTTIPPYYENFTENITPEEVFATLKFFGHSSFRPGQEQAVMRILCGKSTLVTLSTGSGKSLCYQLPAYLYAQKYNCISLVISPLVSLMEDQVTGIPSFLKAACLHTNQTKTQRDKVLDALSKGGLSILLVSPEAIVAGEKSSGFGSLLRRLPPIAFACIDEAHCVSQWSHNFRPSYLLICRVLREKLGIKTVLGLTATATRSTSDSIIEHLQIPDGRDGIIRDTPLPDNLILTVSKDHNRDNALLNLLLTDNYKNLKSIIIYCTRREECERIAAFLRTTLRYDMGSIPETQSNSKKRKRINVGAEPYHAGLSASRRRTIQKAFMSGELRIVVATVAFGMGINKSDIRAVIHFNMPKNFESYVQEIGRAGRDGLPAYCHLFMDSQGRDEAELRRHIHANSIDRHVIRKLLQKIFIPCSCEAICAKHEVAFSIEETVRSLDIPEENISTLLCYLELHKNKYIELLSPAYTVCKVISYAGEIEIKKAAKECPPLAMALALRKNPNGKEQNILQFAVVDIAAAIGWDSGICKHKLKNLEWTVGFRLLAPGNLTDDELDAALDSLYEHTVKQERTALLQLRAVHQTLKDVSAKTYNTCDLDNINKKLKTKIREYFDAPYPLENVTLDENQIVDEGAVLENIRGIISMYRDNNFTGRSIARIFHGITSPNYPAVIWGRCRFWRCHLNVDFHTICKIATKEILKIRDI